jgi:trk system potassium uptake protein TrkA
MYFVIVGTGRVGGALARWLVTAGHEVSTVDTCPARCAELDAELGSVSVLGDGTQAGILARAGTNRADVFVAATGSDEDNLVACQLARHRFGATSTAALVHIPEHERLFSLLGVDICINTTSLVLVKIKDILSGLFVEER